MDAAAEKVGMATASSPFGPFKRYPNNPVFSYDDSNNRWCASGQQARVDEIKPTNIGGQNLLVVKSAITRLLLV